MESAKQKIESSKHKMESFFLLPDPVYKIDFQNKKWNYFSHFQARKTSFKKCWLFIRRGLKLIFYRGNRIIQTGNGIISPTSRPLIKIFFYKILLICPKGLNIDFQNRKRNHQNRKWIILPIYRPLIKKLLLQNISHLFQEAQN